MDMEQELVRKRGLLAFHSWRGPQTPGRHVKAGLLPPPIEIRGLPYWPRRELEIIRDARLRGADDEAVKALVREIVAARASASSTTLAAA